MGARWPLLTAEATPRVQLDSWTVSVDGLVKRPTTCTWGDVQQLPRSSYAGDLLLCDNVVEVRRHLRWRQRGDLLVAAEPFDDARFVMAYSRTGYSTNSTRDDDVSGGKAWLVWEYGGQPLVRARWPRSAPGAALVLLEVGQVDLASRVPRRGPTGLLGTNRLPRPGNPWLGQRYLGDP